MGQVTKIAWTHATFNPWLGCQKVSPGCQFCYAEELMDTRYGRVEWGPKGSRSRTSERNWEEPLKWDTAAREAGERRRVFCASLADVFEEFPQLDKWRADLWRLIEQTPNLDWLLLTKRPQNVPKMIPQEWVANPPQNVWLGTSIENQRVADVRVKWLLAAPAFPVRFLSCEPLLAPLDLEHIPLRTGDTLNSLTGQVTDSRTGCLTNESYPSVEWIIVGGESGRKARPFDLAWARQMVEQCRRNGTACFVKQLGDRPYERDRRIFLRAPKGGDPAEWPEDLRIRNFPSYQPVG
jgi:protein gp37